MKMLMLKFGKYKSSKLFVKNVFRNWRIVYIALLLFLLSVVSFLYIQNAFSLHFVDEEHNFIMGKYLLKDEVLYDDLISNHQPFGHIFSMAVQKATNPTSILTLVKRHREAVVVWSSCWIMLLIFYFGFRILIFIFIYELTKFYLFGQMFLSESLVAYPMVFLISLVLTKYNLNNKELFCAGICLVSCGLFLAPLWPLLFFLLVMMLFVQKKFSIQKLGLVLSGSILVLILVSNYISFEGYFKYPLLGNLKYTVPAMSNDVWYISLIKSFTAPIQSLVTYNGSSSIILIIQVLSVLLILNLIILLVKKKYFLAINVFIILGLSNLRYYPPGNEYYQGFHLLPWYAALITVVCILTIIINAYKWRWFNILSGLMIVGLVLIAIHNYQNDFFKKQNPKNDFFINYSTQESLGEAVRIMKNGEDKLLVVPDEWLIYWHADINHLNKLFGYYLWLSTIPDINSQIKNILENNPPAFLYINMNTSEFDQYLFKYQPLLQAGEKTKLYVLKSKINILTTEQNNQLDYHRFEFD